MDARSHWENVYTTKAPDAVSWYRQHLEISLGLIEKVAPARSSSIIDVGGGESTLVDDLLARGYQKITVLDVSPTAIDVTKFEKIALGFVLAHVRLGQHQSPTDDEMPSQRRVSV